MKTIAAAIIGTSSIVASADAGFLGFVAAATQRGGYVFVDVFAAVSDASDRFLSVSAANITTTNVGGFHQDGGAIRKTWRPEPQAFTATRSAFDSFMTAGTWSGGAYAGEYYASDNTVGDTSQTGSNAVCPWADIYQQGSPPCNTFAPGSGWYTADPTSIDNRPELLNFTGYARINSGATAASGIVNGSTGTANAVRGIWVSHMALANATVGNFRIDYSAIASIKDGMTGAVDQRISTFVIPTPGAIALLGIGGIAVRRRRG